ncbi:hypothetical protein LCGC14_3098050 [marine sediment metagenome]|uniref:Uncharacterized protein n=1 Tax=marine sediment metagenome TaxID=412755 RepID=A0A0F8YG05_9ZZZZ
MINFTTKKKEQEVFGEAIVDADGDLSFIVNGVRILFISRNSGIVCRSGIGQKSMEALESAGIATDTDKRVVRIEPRE